MRPSPGNIIVRANYLATAIFGPMLALIVAAYWLSGELASPTKDLEVIAWILLPTIILFVLPGARAIRRVFANGTVIPAELVHERPIVFFFSLALFPYLISLLCAELALVGNGVSDAARTEVRPF